MKGAGRLTNPLPHTCDEPNYGNIHLKNLWHGLIPKLSGRWLNLLWRDGIFLRRGYCQNKTQVNSKFTCANLTMQLLRTAGYLPNNWHGVKVALNSGIFSEYPPLSAAIINQPPCPIPIFAKQGIAVARIDLGNAFRLNRWRLAYI
jgi:hypothetical protein